ncbi:MAG: DinB family protein [Acidobacteriota bacterium]
MGPDFADICRRQLEFLQWADELMLAAVAEHMPGEIVTLRHIYCAEAVWLGRVQGQQNLALGDVDAPPDVATLQRAWPKIHRGWLDWAASVADWNAVVPHRNSKGEEFRTPAWQVTLHLVNHGSYHRGQVAAMLRAAGFAPPATDLIVYYRAHGM